MTLGFAVKIIIEVLVVLLIAYGIMNEEKLVAFEDELYPVLKFCFRKYILRNIPEKAKTPVLRLKVIKGRETDADADRSVA